MTKYLAGIFLFIFWAVVTALLTAGLLSRQKELTTANVLSSATNQTTTNNPQSNGISTNSTVLTASEVAKHNTAGDCWMIVNGGVYNLTSLTATHSGGSQEIIRDCGKDGSVGFNTKYENTPHSGGAKAIMKNYYLGGLGATAQATQITTTTNTPSRQSEEEDDD